MGETGRIVTVERKPAGQHLEQGNADGVHVRSNTDALPLEPLRGGVREGAKGLRGVRLAGLRRDSRNTEVGQFGA